MKLGWTTKIASIFTVVCASSAISLAQSEQNNTSATSQSSASTSTKLPAKTVRDKSSGGRLDAHERLQHLKSLQLREKDQEKTAAYHNQPMGFSTVLPEGSQITELGDRAMRAFLPRPDSFLSFAATAQPVSAQVDLAWFFQQTIQHLPASWRIMRQEATTIDGTKAYALEAQELHPSGNTYRERIYVMRGQRIVIFDVSCPMNNVKTNNSSIKTIWTQLHF